MRHLLIAVVAIVLATPLRAGATCTEGDALLEAGDPAAAVRAYRAAIARPECASELAALRINEGYAREKIARSTERSDDYCEALYAWRRALPGASERAAVAIEASIEAMSARCVQPARLIIECRPAGASVRIDGLGELQPCPARFERVPPGRYTGIALAAGVETPFEIEAEPGATTRIEVTLAQPSLRSVTTLEDPGFLAGPDAPITNLEQPAAPDRDLAPYAWTAAALAVVAGGVALAAAVYRVETIDDAEALNADARALDSSDGDFSRDARRYNARYDVLEEDHAAASDVVVGASVAAGVFTAIAVTLFVFDADPSPSVGGLRVGVGVVSVEF